MWARSGPLTIHDGGRTIPDQFNREFCEPVQVEFARFSETEAI